MEEYFKIALEEAEKSFKKNEIPVGAVIVKNNKVISKAHNTRQLKKSVLGHAEINCIIKAGKKLGDWRLNDCIMYCTLKPCEMCQEVIKESRIAKVYYLLEKTNKIKFNTEIIQTNVCLGMLDKYLEDFKLFFDNLRK